MAHEIQQRLNELVVGEVPSCSEVIQISSDQELVPSFERLIEADILSAPVRNCSTGKWVGFLDVRDMVSWIVALHTNSDRDPHSPPSPQRSSLSPNSPVGRRTLLSNLFRGRRPAHFGRRSSNLSAFGGGEPQPAVACTGGVRRDAAECLTVSYLSCRHKFQPVCKDTPLLEAMQHLASGPRRLPVWADGEESGVIGNILSQTRLIQYIFPLIEDLQVLQRSICELDIINQPVLSIEATQPAIEAFKMIDANRINNVAVTDPTGGLMATISGLHVKRLLREPDLCALDRPIEQLLTDIGDAPIGNDMLTVMCDDSLHSVLQKVVTHKLHRVFVVAQRQLLGVISLRDIFATLLKL